MQQYRHFKQQHPDCVLFFRMGDFYEMFYDDAKLANKVLGVTLTQRTAGIPMAGVPFHSVDGYLQRMVKAGYRIAVCEQVGDAADAKAAGKVIQRDVARLITPGTLTDEHLLEESQENYLAAVVIDAGESEGKGGGKSGGKSGRACVAWSELSTGAFAYATFGLDELSDELARIGPRELLYAADDRGIPKTPESIDRLCQDIGAVASPRPGWQFRMTEASETLCQQYRVARLTGFGFAEDDPCIGAAGALVTYLRETQQTQADGVIGHLRAPRRFERATGMVIDQASLRSLEIERTTRSGTTEGSLLAVLQSGAGGAGCRTAMGKRLMRQWLCYPLANREAIETRQRVVGVMVDDERFRDELRERLDEVQDVQRIVGRIAVGRAMPRDLVALGRSVGQVVAIGELLDQRPSVSTYHDRVMAVRDELEKLAAKINAACVDSPPAHLRDGGLIRDGFDAELDESRSLQRDSHTWLAEYQKTLAEQTGLSTIKIGFNKVFGFYIELSAANKDKAPDAWSRKQTLKNAERFITPELKQYETKVLNAEQLAIAREQLLFGELCAAAEAALDALSAFAEVVSELDVLGCFADRAVRHGYVQPELVNEPVLSITAGRHPVLDAMLGDRFVPNDVGLGVTGEAGALQSLALITGPNMAGKSTYIRQTALITLLAHTGSFVPAEKATVGLCDRIFTRIGASDELHTGQSTFMVEMTETANICHHATERSLVILDEIGRGTSTLDGLSLAWAITEHLAQRGCRTLFATHYHELTRLSERYSQVTNLNVSVREWNDEVVFLHRIVAGATDRSYGIHVAKIAGLPPEVVSRAHELLGQLAVREDEGEHLAGPTHTTNSATTTKGTKAAKHSKHSSQVKQAAEPIEQLPLFGMQESEVEKAMRELDMTNLTPMQAFDWLREWRDKV